MGTDAAAKPKANRSTRRAAASRSRGAAAHYLTPPDLTPHQLRMVCVEAYIDETTGRKWKRDPASVLATTRVRCERACRKLGFVADDGGERGAA